MALKLTPAEKALITTARQTIEDARDRLQGEYDERSDKWQATPAAAEAGELIEKLSNLADDLADLEE